MAMDESEFESLADRVLNALYDQLDDQLGDVADVDLEGGILKISLDAGGEFILNKHAPNRQLWLSSPISGASHYDHTDATKRWVGTRTGDDLLILLAADLTEKTGTEIELEP